MSMFELGGGKKDLNYICRDAEQNVLTIELY